LAAAYRADRPGPNSRHGALRWPTTTGTARRLSLAAWPRSRARGTVPQVSASSITPSTPTDGGAHPTSRTRLSQGAPTLASTSRRATTRSGPWAASPVPRPPPRRVAGQDGPLHPELVQDPAEQAPVLVEAPAVVGDPAAGDVDGHHPEAGRGQPAEGLHVQPGGQQQPAGQHQGEALPADGHADPAPVHGEAVLGKPRIGGRPVGSDPLRPRVAGA